MGGLPGVYGLVTTDELAYTGYTSNMTIHLDIDNIEEIRNKILLIKNGSQVVRALVIDDTELSVELPVGVYEAELPAPDNKSYLYNNEYLVASKGTAATFSYKHETGNPLADDMQIKLLERENLTGIRCWNLRAALVPGLKSIMRKLELVFLW